MNFEKLMRALQMRSWRAKSAIFPIWAPFFPIWARGERSLSATWAPKMRSLLFSLIERDQIAFQRKMSAKITLCYSFILPVLLSDVEPIQNSRYPAAWEYTVVFHI
jgi:hypothetical protein